MPRFFVEKGNDNLIEINGEDARHISRSLRMKIGEEITVCDFFNTEYACVLESISDSVVLARVVEKHPSLCEPSVKVTILQALPKGDKLDTVIQKAVELGAVRIVPVITERCVSRPDTASASKKRERWQKIALEAAKQCGRGSIPCVENVLDFPSALKLMQQSNLAFMCYEKETVASLRGLLDENEEIISKEGAEIAFFVGSEGGFSDKEASMATEHGIKTVTLGKRILRTETAPLAVLASIMFRTHNLE